MGKWAKVEQLGGQIQSIRPADFQNVFISDKFRQIQVATSTTDTLKTKAELSFVLLDSITS